MPMMPSRTACMRKDQAIPLKSQDRNESTALARHGSNDGTASSQSAPSFSRWHGFIAKHETSRSENATEDCQRIINPHPRQKQFKEAL